MAGIWYTADGDEIGPEIWGAFAIVQQIENDPGQAVHGKQYLSPHGPGLGKYSPEKVNELLDAGELDPADVADLVDSGGASE